MFNRDEGGREGAMTIIARGVKVEGDFVSDGNVTIEGEVIGSVKAAGHLEVGPDAKIKADVSAGSAVVAGEISGNFIVSGKLDLLENSRLDGDVTVAVFSVAPGAKINGRVTMNGKNGEAAA
ncbi:MAG: polymer-forming cytoskeletal protein [Patescibacteria group bacterium]|jgi:cytoskeletal protein CcmA (bactofilin family)